MIARLRERPIDLLLGVVAALLIYVAMTAYLEAQVSTTALAEARADQSALVREAAQYNLEALQVERDELVGGSGRSAFPTREAVELQISEIARLIAEAGVVLGPIVRGEVSRSVANHEIGLDAETPAPRTYDGIELALSLDGAVVDLLSLAERLLSNVPEAALADVTLSQESASADATLTVRVLLYHRPF